MGRRLGLDSTHLQALPDPEQATVFTPLEQLALRYAEDMTSTPVTVSDELFAALAEHFNAAQLVELTSCIAWENYRARFDHACGVESEGFDDPARDQP